MASATTRRPFVLESRPATRLLLGIIGTSLLLGSMLTPWWTRGLTTTYNDANPRPQGFPVEGFYASYGPFSTPGSFSGFSTDAGRATAVAVLGIALSICIACVLVYHGLRIGRALGRVETSPDVPTRFAIAATLLGSFAVLWAALFLPLLGPNPGWLYGTEGQSSGPIGPSQFVEGVRYANVGMFLGLLGAVAYPVYLWIEAATERRAAASLNVTLDEPAGVAA